MTKNHATVDVIAGNVKSKRRNMNGIERLNRKKDKNVTFVRMAIFFVCGDMLLRK